jgi:hypothetical protein
MQWCSTVVVFDINTCAAVSEHFHNLLMALLNGKMQGRHAFFIRRIHIAPAIQNDSGNIFPTIIGSIM